MSASSPNGSANRSNESASDGEVTDVVQSDNAVPPPAAGTLSHKDFDDSRHKQQDMRIEEGTDVIGTCGHKVGEVMDIQGEYLVVEKGFFNPCDLYVPKSAIASKDKHGLHLNMSKHDVDDAGWDCEPGEVNTGTRVKAAH